MKSVMKADDVRRTTTHDGVPLTHLLDVRDLAIDYGAGSVISDISFTLDAGQWLAIVGESGSGKTTIIRSLIGCLSGRGRIVNGEIYFDGKDITHLSTREWQAYRGRRMAMIFQDSGQAMDQIMTVGAQLTEHIRRLTGVTLKEALQEAQQLLASVSLAPNILLRYPFELSGGQRQRLGIAMAMAVTPQLLLADEPTSALDTTTQAQVADVLLQACREKQTAGIIVTHNIGLAKHMADAIMVMKKGQVVDYGPTDKVLFDHPAEYTQALLRAVPSLEGERYISDEA